MKIFFTLFTSLSNMLVKSYKKDFTKSIGASMYIARYQRLQMSSLKIFDTYLNNMNPYETITLGLTKDETGISKTANAYNEVENPDFIYRGKNHIKYLNDLYPYVEGMYSLYFFDVDYDEQQPSHFQMNTAEEVRASLILLVPELKDCTMLIRPSSSAGVYNTQTGEKRSDKPSWHIYVVVANATAQTVKNFTEYIKRRANKDDVNLAYIKESKSGVKLERFYVDLAVADASRLIIEGNPILEYPLAKLNIPSTIIGGGVLDLSTIDFEIEKDYRQNIRKYVPSTLNTLPIMSTLVPMSHGGKIIISKHDRDKIITIYSYLQKTKNPELSVVREYLNANLVGAVLTFLGFAVDTNFKFKMRDEKTASASIAYNGYLKDFGGTFSGDIISFLIAVYALSFIEAWKYFQNCFGKNYKMSIKTQVALPNAKAFETSLTINIK